MVLQQGAVRELPQVLTITALTEERQTQEPNHPPGSQLQRPAKGLHRKDRYIQGRAHQATARRLIQAIPEAVLHVRAVHIALLPDHQALHHHIVVPAIHQDHHRLTAREAAGHPVPDRHIVPDQAGQAAHIVLEAAADRQAEAIRVEAAARVHEVRVQAAEGKQIAFF
jgi:hypothetical protein